MRADLNRYVYCTVMGDGMVGKTSISESYTQDSFSDSLETTVFDNYVVPLNVAGEDFVISVFDTAGQAEYESLRAFAFRESEVLLLCFSTCDRQSFHNITHLWMSELKRHTKQTKRKRPVILVGTQIDLRVGDEDGEVSWDEGVQLEKHIGADCYVECSARDRRGLRDVFMHVVFSALKARTKKKNFLKELMRKLKFSKRK